MGVSTSLNRNRAIWAVVDVAIRLVLLHLNLYLWFLPSVCITFALNQHTLTQVTQVTPLSNCNACFWLQSVKSSASILAAWLVSTLPTPISGIQQWCARMVYLYGQILNLTF
jgi:hypothetical protein